MDSAWGQMGGFAEKKTELLVKQVEGSDVVLVSKVDIAADARRRTAENVVMGLNNPGARVVRNEFGIALLTAVLGLEGSAAAKGVKPCRASGVCGSKNAGAKAEEEKSTVACINKNCGDPGCSTHGHSCLPPRPKAAVI